MEQGYTMRHNGLEKQDYFNHSEGATLITGATGLIGSHIAGDLLKRGQHVIVVIRSNGGRKPTERFASLCDFIGLSPSQRSNAAVYEGSLEKHNFGMDDHAYTELCRHTERIIHCAGNTTFSPKDIVTSERDNISGLKNVLTLCRHSESTWFHFISSAYSTGIKTGICEEKLEKTQSFTNIYEEMKYKGEVITLDYCRKHDIRTTIIRPSIVIGNSRDGSTFRFNGMYYPIKALILIRDMFLRNLLSGDGKRARQMSITYRSGTLHIPLRLENDPNGGINVIPIDFVVDSVHAILSHPQNERIYHIAAKQYVPMSQLLEFTGKFFKISGLSTVQTGYFITNKKNPIEALFHSYIEPYLPYMKDKRSFRTKNTDRILSGSGIRCPSFDYELFSLCMNFALTTKWGKTLDI